MKIIIVEDEPISALELKKLIASLDSSMEVVCILDTIEDAVNEFRREQPDLVFLDIELADGSAFEIFDEVEITCPIIFTTAFDEYALKAFEQNSIAYLLKPITKTKLKGAFDDLKKMECAVLKSSDYRRLFDASKPYKKNFLVKYGNALIPITSEKINYFFSEENLVYLVDTEGKKYLSSHTLTQLEELLNPEIFFRTNRQYIIHKQAVLALKPHVKGQVLVSIKSSDKIEIVISRQKTTLLKEWLS